MPKGVPIGRNFYRNFGCIIFDVGKGPEIVFNIGMVEIFVPVISSEPGGHHFPKLLLCS